MGASLGEREPLEREKDRHPGTVLASPLVMAMPKLLWVISFGVGEACSAGRHWEEREDDEWTDERG